MTPEKPATTTGLMASQLHLLQLVYAFQFVTVGLVGEYRGATPESAHIAINRLVKRGLVDRNYESSFRLLGRPAEYYLSKSGLRLIRSNSPVTPALHGMYANNKLSRSYIDHRLAVFSLYNALRRQTSDTFKILTKAELSTFDYFPSPRPDLYAHQSYAEDSSDYLIELVADLAPIAWRKRVLYLISHFESGEWEATTGQPYPVIILVTKDTKQAAVVRKFVDGTLYRLGVEDLTIQVKEISAIALG